MTALPPALVYVCRLCRTRAPTRGVQARCARPGCALLGRLVVLTSLGWRLTPGPCDDVAPRRGDR